MKRRCILPLLILLVSLTGCASNVKQEVEVFNQNTEKTINLYEDIKSARYEKTEELILAIANGDDIGIEVSSKAKDSIKEARKLLNSSEFADIIEAVPFIKTDDYYTRLGYNCVTQICVFSYQGQTFLLEILWTEGTVLDTLSLEVVS